MSDWTDPDDAPSLTKDFFRRAEVRVGDKVVREAQGTYTRDFNTPAARRRIPETARKNCS